MPRRYIFYITLKLKLAMIYTVISLHIFNHLYRYFLKVIYK